MQVQLGEQPVLEREACPAEGTMNEHFSLCRDFWNLLGPNSLIVACPLLTNVWKRVIRYLPLGGKRKLRWFGPQAAGKGLCCYFLPGVEKVTRSRQASPGL